MARPHYDPPFVLTTTLPGTGKVVGGALEVTDTLVVSLDDDDEP